MRYRQVASMDLKFSEVGLGCWAFSGDSVWDGYDKRSSIATIHEALDAGIQFFDVAPIYGFGQAERVLGEALAGRSRDSVVIASKCGLVWDDAKRDRIDLSGASIRDEIEASLCRLQTDYIDLYQMHWPDPLTPIEETMDMLVQLKEQGKIRYIGASNYSISLNEEANRYGPIASQQSLYNMIERNPSTYHAISLTYRTEAEILPYCKEHGQAFFPYSPLFQGLLSGRFEPEGNFSEQDVRNNNPKLRGDRFTQYYKLIESLTRYSAESIGRPMNEVAINWLLHRNEVTSVICGAQTPEQIRANAKASEWRLTDQQFAHLNDIVELRSDLEH
ncbi:aldo/keto reductase [Cohnella terricola]|uniref:Aldo/keto reductase n=1 Tax=Cohnella terricola TaxID=1289167 RepID=A0A559J8U4_9BACL|nr:aldo/keto reductase [Cohnella terricola]TVX96256.1 aldo/keto reductase [Cohnella terricola]